MAYRQYIGARYVPKLVGAWQANTFYEGLSIVTDNNVSYTSKKPVPATVGAPAENPEYWVATGNYNAQMAQILEEVGDLTTDVDNLSTNVGNLSTDVENLSTRVDNISSNLSNKNLFVVGDSWASSFTDSTGQGFVEELSDRNIFKSVRKYSMGGIGYVAANGSTTLLTKLQALESDYHDHLEDVNIIIVEGGVNDYPYGANEITTAARTLFTYAKSHFPNAEIYAIANITSIRSTTNYAKSEIALRVASECGCIPLYWPHRMLYGHQPQFTNDTYHIKHDACVFYANNIINNILGYFAFDPDGDDIATPLGTSPMTDFSSQSQRIAFHERYVDLEINLATGVPSSDGSTPLFEFNTNLLPSISISKAYSLYKPSFICDRVFGSGTNLRNNTNDFVMGDDGKVSNIYSAANFSGNLVLGYMHFRFDRLARTFV